MCGIAGILNRIDGPPPPTVEQLGSMARILHHRGPDELGVYRDAWAGLAHSRLSIIDLASGQQPPSNEDGTLWIAFNGEIFNYLELREELLALGHAFRTRSDTEVIVHAWEAWGEQALGRFNGQFAIALWDSREKALALARDWCGIRPLHFLERAFITQNFYAASTMDLTDDASLLELGVMDSTGVLEVVTFLETDFDITVDDDEMLPENLDSVANIVAFAERKTQGWSGSLSFHVD